MVVGCQIHLSGIVQGVGFRPFVYKLAMGMGLSGWVLNSSSGVEIKVVGPSGVLDSFACRLRSDAPSLARIDYFSVATLPNTEITALQGGGFTIKHSEARLGDFQPISPDIAICDDCLRELFDPGDRRYRYPFINCTNCGPRFTIIRDIPYDRAQTTMAPFEMCSDCKSEYENPTDRRFHAQPNACLVCGPRVWFQPSSSSSRRPERSYDEEAVQATRQTLAGGGIVAVRGLGGFHLACDATNNTAVARLRKNKGRVDKAFAIMSFDLDAVEQYCELDEAERSVLTSRERPIVILRRRTDDPISALVAPHNKYLGVMLPYTPLHYLLLEPTEANPRFPLALVMTSGNRSEEPIATDNEEALERLSGLADAFLLHNRDIYARCDDSVTRVFAGAELPIRRSRGYAPYPIHLPWAVEQILATGGGLKSTFCLTRDRYAFLSQHIGDMENYETLHFFDQMVRQLCSTFRVQPKVIACDMHPGYLSTQWARGAIPSLVPLEASRLEIVQHHHAHVAACMAEHGLDGEERVIGVVFDGTGYGTDRAIWGGEFLIADYSSFDRAAHLKYTPLPGGDAAIRSPYRVAMAQLWAAGVTWTNDLPSAAAASPAQKAILIRQLERGINTVPTSSMGRLFDTVSSLAGVRQVINYEGQAAIELEMLVQPHVKGAYEFAIEGETIDSAPVVRAVAKDAAQGTPPEIIASRFHNGVAKMIQSVCRQLREQSGINVIVLSGGVFQNVTLLRKALDLLSKDGFVTLTHHLVPPNDGGISLGQAVIASKRLSSPAG